MRLQALLSEEREIKVLACPHCDFQFKKLLANAAHIPPIAPAICERCANVSLIEFGVIRKLTDEELESLKQSPAWKSFIAPAREAILNSKGQSN